jgi:hypothetical protein
MSGRWKSIRAGLIVLGAMCVPLSSLAAARDESARRDALRASADHARRPGPKVVGGGEPTYPQRLTRQRLGSRYVVVPMKPNPLQSSEYRATPEYEYLYTASTTARSVPPVARYNYARDNTYLLRPALLSKAGASAYAFTYSHLYVGTLDPASASGRPSIARDPGRKGDNVLKPFVVAPLDRQAITDSPRLRAPFPR